MILLHQWPKMVIVKSLIAIVTAKGWLIDQLDVNNAFLHGELEEEVFMDLSQGYIQQLFEGQKLVCKLKKSLYSLKQAFRQCQTHT